ncbi:Uncharacterized protein OBRU01_23644 [Operophtera brumata]|uniref:Zinc finger DNA binding protein n=1 Tax=Operophtera brumata TaxID=104452 RepID=A0A0L7KNV5_OPEBR|nr:Uncharacterized protein OBRU01_23644 [Operophtera brumata]
MSKCIHCSKIITKKNPGLECNKCGSMVHANTTCTELSNKQLNVVRSADNLDWTCNPCIQKSLRRGSYLIPEEDAEEDEEFAGSPRFINSPVDTTKFLAEISAEMDKLLKREMKETNKAIQYCCGKVDDCLEFMETFKEKIKELEKKNIDLNNKNKHLELHMQALEQRVNESEQKVLSKVLEIQSIPSAENENIIEVSKVLARKLQVSVDHIKTAKRMPTKTGKPAFIQIKLCDEEKTSEWVTAARSANLISSDIVSHLPEKDARTKSSQRVRKALTHHYKNLLWVTKQELKDTYKYMWCKDGRVLARKSDKERITIIRCATDVKNLM